MGGVRDVKFVEFVVGGCVIVEFVAVCVGVGVVAVGAKIIAREHRVVAPGSAFGHTADLFLTQILNLGPPLTVSSPQNLYVTHWGGAREAREVKERAKAKETGDVLERE